jgi:hypothetical protein
MLIVCILQNTEDMTGCQIGIKLASSKYQNLIFSTTEALAPTFRSLKNAFLDINYYPFCLFYLPIARPENTRKEHALSFWCFHLKPLLFVALVKMMVNAPKNV